MSKDERIISEQFEDNIEVFLEDTNPVYSPIGRKINVYKFRKVSGITQFTTFGEKKVLNTNPENNQIVNVYNGKEPVVVVWEGSTKLIGDKDTNTIKKEYKLGEFYECYWSETTNNSIENEELEIFGVEYQSEFIKKTISLQTPNWEPTTKDQLDYWYLVIDKKANIYQWLELKEYVKEYNELDNTFQYSNLSFETINLKYASTGKSILDFVQFGAIAEGYALPIENEEGVPNLDYSKLYDKGATNIQFDFLSGVANSSFYILGRKASTFNDSGELMVDIPHRLFLFQANFPITSDLFYNQPNSNCYSITNAKPTMKGVWNSYKTAPNINNLTGNYNINASKTVIGGFENNVASTRDTNIFNTNTNRRDYTNWDNNIANVSYDLNVSLEPIVGVKNATKLTRSATYANAFNINSYLNFYTDVYNYEYKEETKYKLTDTLGIFGGILNTIVGGLDLGWTSSRVQAGINLKQPMNLITPIISYENSYSALDESAPLSAEVFSDDKSAKFLPVSTDILTSWNFTLTDRIIMPNVVIENNEIGKGGQGIWLTKYLGQTKFEDGTNIFPDGSELVLDLNTFEPYFPSTINGFVIDYIKYHVVGISDVRITAYDLNGNNIYTSLMETTSKVRGDIRCWANEIKFNYYEEFNTIGQINYPALPSIPPAKLDNSFSFPLGKYDIRTFGRDDLKFNQTDDRGNSWKINCKERITSSFSGANYSYIGTLEKVPTSSDWFWFETPQKKMIFNTEILIPPSMVGANKFWLVFQNEGSTILELGKPTVGIIYNDYGEDNLGSWAYSIEYGPSGSTKNISAGGTRPFAVSYGRAIFELNKKSELTYTFNVYYELIQEGILFQSDGISASAGTGKYKGKIKENPDFFPKLNQKINLKEIVFEL